MVILEKREILEMSPDLAWLSAQGHTQTAAQGAESSERVEADTGVQVKQLDFIGKGRRDGTSLSGFAPWSWAEG